MPPKNNTNNTNNAKKRVLKPTPKIYGYFKINNLNDDYAETSNILKEQLKDIYHSFFKSIKITSSKKDGENTGLFSLYLTEQAKDITREQFNHINRIISNQTEKLPFIKLFFVSTNETAGAKYTYSNFVKNEQKNPIPNIFFFCETNDINISCLKEQLRATIKGDYLDFYAVANKSKTEYNPFGGFFCKIRLNKDINKEFFINISNLIQEYFKENYQEYNIKTYYKTEEEKNGLKYTFTFPEATNKPLTFQTDDE